MTDLTDDLMAALEGFEGALLRPRDTGYEQTRCVFNGIIDKRPALIAQCQGVGDIVAVVNFARENGFEVSIRGGGHSIAGKGTTEGGIMIDLSRMKGIHVDPARRTARAQGGVTWREFNRETQLHGLAVTGGVVSTTGIAGLTLGGGIGWLMGKYGLAADNLISAEVVTADGRILVASEEENEDLFWALRGGGGNFGVVASFEYRLYAVGPMVTWGVVLHPYRAAGEFLRFYRDFTAALPDELAVNVDLVHAPDGSGQKMAAAAFCHLDPPEQAEKDLQPLLTFGSPVQTEIGPTPYTAVNMMADEANPAGSLNYYKSSFVEELSDDAIDTMVDCFASCPSPMSGLGLELFHGEVTRVPDTATAYPHRNPGYDFLMISVWLDPTDTDENVTWTRETYKEMGRFLSKRRYVNYLSEDDCGVEPVRSSYGPNYERLVQVKRKYDPANFFRLNFNINPAP